jgi:hypothetical protein
MLANGSWDLIRRLKGLKHLTEHNILSTEQYGLRIGLKKDNAIYKLTTEILNAMNNKLPVGGFYVIRRKHLIVLIIVFYYTN